MSLNLNKSRLSPIKIIFLLVLVAALIAGVVLTSNLKRSSDIRSSAKYDPGEGADTGGVGDVDTRDSKSPGGRDSRSGRNFYSPGDPVPEYPNQNSDGINQSIFTRYVEKVFRRRK